jgi:hypothetical protein
LDLAFHTEIHGELRTEIDSAVQEHGWSGRALSQMRKLDSFLTESQRLSPLASCELHTSGLNFTANALFPSPIDSRGDSGFHIL